MLKKVMSLNENKISMLYKIIDDSQNIIRGYDTKASFLLALAVGLISVLLFSCSEFIKIVFNVVKWESMGVVNHALLVSILLCSLLILFLLFCVIYYSVNVLCPRNNPLNKLHDLDCINSEKACLFKVFYLQSPFSYTSFSHNIDQIKTEEDMLIVLKMEALKLNAIREMKDSVMKTVYEFFKVFLISAFVMIFFIMLIVLSL